MGIQDKGAFDGFRQKTGLLIGMKVNGQNVITGLHNKSNKAPTPLQLEQRILFKLMMQFLRPVTAIIRQGYQDHARIKSAMNTAMSYHVKEAVSGTYPDVEINYKQVKFSVGVLGMSHGSGVSVTEESGLKFEWANPASSDNAATDTVTLIVYNPVRKRFITLTNAATRGLLTCDLAMPVIFSGEEVHCYMFFTSAAKNSVSNSEYLGTVTLP